MTLSEKIARLVAERGWNKEEFARQAGFNRHTARRILLVPGARLRNQTLKQCADALKLSVHQLEGEPLSKLLTYLRRATELAKHDTDDLTAEQPELRAWLDQHPEYAATLSKDELEELASLHGVGGPLTPQGVEHYFTILERKRELKRRLDLIAGTEYLDLIEMVIDFAYEKIQPYRVSEPRRQEAQHPE